MNSIKFDQTLKKFPLSTKVLAFSQAIIQQAHQLALLGGTGNYILTGCENTTGSTWSPGYVVVNGELLPFMGGTGQLTSNVRIKQDKTNVVAEYDTYPEVYTERYVEFGNNTGGVDTFVWNTFTRVKSNLQLAAESATKLELEALSSLMMPKGGIIMWSGAIAAIPTGYKLCDGNGGVPVNGVTIPDLRGRFIVGVDERITTSSVPTNVTDLTQNYGVIGSTGGKPNVTLKHTESGLPVHSHQDVLAGDNGWTNCMGAGSSNLHSQFTDNAGGTDAAQAHENRPPYFVLAFIVKTV